MKQGGTALAAAAASVLLAMAAAPGRAAPTPPPLAITAVDFAFHPSEISVRSGEVTFAVKNDGVIEHNFAIEDAARKVIAEIAVIAPGKTETLKVTLRQGTYTMVCTLPGHRDAGMHGKVTVLP